MKYLTGIAVLLTLTGFVYANEPGDAESQTVLGALNPELTDGAVRLRLGDAQAGIRLTQRGLLNAANTREEYVAYSNLCAGYILVRNLDEAVRYCDKALHLNERNHSALSNRALARFYQEDYERARIDVDAGLALAPYSRSLKRVSQMIEDKVNPVTPVITIEHAQQNEDSVDEQ